VSSVTTEGGDLHELSSLKERGAEGFERMSGNKIFERQHLMLHQRQDEKQNDWIVGLVSWL